jgi:magnesium-transporting ATPase (P-type)
VTLSLFEIVLVLSHLTTHIFVVSFQQQITFTEWCWVFMDGIWTITLGFSLPLANPAAKLSETRPTASVLGPWTMSSALGVLAIHFTFTVIALATLWNQDWFQCRKWDDNDVSDVTVIGDNYESEVIFLVTGFQYISTAIVYNFGYEFRQVWYRNITFMFLAALYTFMQFYITMVPGELSCIWRVNCLNENTVKSVTSREPFPLQNPYATTVMPTDFRCKYMPFLILAPCLHSQSCV